MLPKTKFLFSVYYSNIFKQHSNCAYLYTNTHKCFKNKISLSNENFEICKYPSFIQCKVLSGGTNAFRSKVFFFDTKITYDNLMSKLESEYDSSFQISPELKSFIEKIITEENVYTFNSSKIPVNHINEIMTILKKIGLDSSDSRSSEFLSKIFKDSFEQERELKFLYFTIAAELEKLEKTKFNIEQRSENRALMFLTILFLSIIYKMISFYYDLYKKKKVDTSYVENVALLFNGALFLMGIVLFAKYTTNPKLCGYLTENLKQRNFYRFNINQEQILRLTGRLGEIKRMLEQSHRL